MAKNQVADLGASPDKQDFMAVLETTVKSIGASWNALKLNIGTFLGFIVAIIAVQIIAFIFIFAAIFNMAATGSVNAFALLFLVLIGLALILVSLIISIGVIHTQIASVRGEHIGFSKVVEDTKPLIFRYLGLSILYAIIIFVGFLLLIIPGILAAFFLSMSMYILVDQNTGVIESLKKSYELVKGHWMVILALAIVYVGISIINAIFSFIPIIGWIPGLVLSVAYFCLPALIYTKIIGK